MKVAGALKAAVISVATVVTVLVFLFAFGLRPLGIEYLEEVLSSYSSDGRISIETGGMNRHILTSVSVKKLKISFDGKSVVSADEVRLSLGLLDIIKLAKGETSAEIDIILKGSRIDFNDDVKNYFFPEVKFPEGSVQDLIEDAKNYVPENNSETSFSQNGKKTFKEILTDNKFSILVDDASVTYNVKGDSLSALNVDMYVSFDEMLSLKVFNADIPLVSGYLNLFGSSGSVRDIRFSSDGSGRAYYSVSGIEFPGKVKIGQVMGNADMADMLVSLTFEMSSLELKDTDLKRGLSGAGVSAVINGDLTQKRFWGRLKAGSMIADDPGFLELDYLQAYDSSIYFSYGGDGRITTEADVSVSGYSKLSYIGDFSLSSTFRMTLEKNDEASGFTVSAFTGRMDNITAAVLPGRNSVRGSYADDRIRLYFNLNGEVFGEFDYSLDTSDSELRMNFSDFSIYSHRKALLKFADKIENFADKETLLSGNLFAKGRFKKENPNGRISLNLATGNVIFKDERQAAAATLEIAISGKTAEVDTLALTAFGYRLSYSGTVDIEKIFPKGKLVLSEAQTGLSVFDMYFSADESLRTYEFEGGLKDHEKLKVSGFVNFSDAYNIVAETTLSTLYGIYQFRLSFNRIDGTFGLKSDRIVMEVSGLFEGKPVFHGWLNDFTIKLNENMNLVFDSDISGFYDFSSKIYSINFKDFLIRISDILSLEFNMLFEKNHINIKGLLINIRSESVKFGGNADFRFDSLEDILKGNTSSLSAEVDFKASESSDFIKANFTENNYSFELATSYRLPVKISLLGRRDNGFYAECSAGDVLFDARFKSRVLRFFNGRGNASTVDFSSFDFSADFINRTLDGSMTFRNTMKKADRDVCQGATVELSAKVDSLAAGALSLAGIDVDAEFELRLRDAYINDSYNLADTDMKVILNKDFYSVSGNMINGIFNRNARYVELSVNREFLAGFSLKGYIDEKVDLFVDDIYFPVEIIDTVTNVPFYHSRGGILEGALLVKGPVKDPSFYGTLYARTLDIDLLWIPDQVLSMKNVVITASGHTFSMGNVPLVGHSTSDRRFYKAEISLELSMQELGVTDMEFHLTIPDDPIDFWLPMYGHGTSQDVNIRGDVSGDLVIWIRNGVLGIDGEISASNTYVTFVIPDMPEWLKDLAVYCSCNLTVNMANNVEFMYPDAENPFLNFTIDEGEKLFLQYDSVTKILSAEGELEMKTGRIYYFQNDFNITEGKIKLKRPIGENSGVDLKFDLTAKIREYDRSGERVDIYLILQNSGFDNMRPRFVSTPTKKESEIIDILGSAVLQTKGRNFSFANIASAAAMATDAIQKLGIIKTNQVFSLASTIRDALGLDIFSAKSQVVENLILDAIPGKNSELSLISRYLNGTTVFAGKYLNKNLFARLTLLLKSERGLSQAKRAQGHFLASDLILDVEFSIDWDNLLGSFSVFTQPIELSVSSFLDNIGLSYSRRFKF